jgi:hypothetical protein
VVLADEIKNVNELQIGKTSRIYRYAQKYSLTQYEILYLLKQKPSQAAPLAMQKEVETMKAISN